MLISSPQLRLWSLIHEFFYCHSAMSMYFVIRKEYFLALHLSTIIVHVLLDIFAKLKQKLEEWFRAFGIIIFDAPSEIFFLVEECIYWTPNRASTWMQSLIHLSWLFILLNLESREATPCFSFKVPLCSNETRISTNKCNGTVKNKSKAEREVYEKKKKKRSWPIALVKPSQGFLMIGFTLTERKQFLRPSKSYTFWI